MKLWQAWNLKTKLVISFSFLFAVSFICSGVFYYYSSVTELKNQSLQLLGSNSAQISRSIELYTEDLEKLSLSVFNDAIIQKAVGQEEPGSVVEQADLSQQVTSHLLNLTVSWPAVQGIYLYPDKQRELIYFWSKRSPPVDYSIEQEPWYPYGDQGIRTPFILWPTMKENTITNFLGEKVFSLVRPINQINTGKRIGYMKIDIHADAFKNLVSFRGNNDSGDSLLYILTDRGQVVYDQRDELTGGKMTDLSGNDVSRLGSSGTIVLQGTQYLYGYYRSDYTRWSALILTPMDAITNKLKVIRNTVMGIEAIVMLLVFAFAWFIATGVTRPLRKMIVTMRHVERGDFTVRAEQTGNRNEIGLLGKVFNQMLDSLQDMIAKIYVAEIREKDARLVALQAQINPHFLFNTLTILKSLGRKGASEDVVAVTESLAHLFRYSLYDWNRTVELREELRLIESYIKIQKYRFQERISFETDIPESLMGCQVLRLTIQPLVENAVVHGLEKRKSGGVVSVRVRASSDTLNIEVADNGAGMDATVKNRLLRRFEDGGMHGSDADGEHMGIALANIQQRLRLVYGSEYGLSFGDVSGEGTAVVLKLPLRLEAKEARHEDHAD
ncbi:sensor histidine kinase [Cohnella suwonensis]|uniref:Sensor histidine kinase n=1 Tax=Cohnella suwonensis TaxID=696072 RepID=A0ABW0LT95_9BACL